MRQSLNFVIKHFPQAIVFDHCVCIQSACRQQPPPVSCSVSQVVFRVSWMLLQCNLSHWQLDLPLNPVSSSPVDLKYSWHLSTNTWDLL